MFLLLPLTHVQFTSYSLTTLGTLPKDDQASTYLFYHGQKQLIIPLLGLLLLLGSVALDHLLIPRSLHARARRPMAVGSNR